MFPDLTRDDVYRLETARLWLRWPRIADARAVQALVGEKDIAVMTASIPHPYPAGEAERYILKSREKNADGEGLALAITRKGPQSELVGVAGIFSNTDGDPEIGYWIGKPFWGEGYATEALHAIIDALFTWTGEPHVTAGVFVGNPASRRVLEKAGFQHDGQRMCKSVARGGSAHSDRFVLTRRTWASLKGWRAPVVDGLKIDVRPAPQMECSVAA
jgi:RimJ/RimL family protein N-acetyltransferase